MKKFATMAICFVLIACMVAGGSLAYLTDRDSEANVFTVGDVRIELSEDFEQGAKLTPGVNIEKAPLIKNTGINDAWVWMEFAIPAALDTVSLNGTAQGSSDNVVHWNYLGATSETYANIDRIQKAFNEGKLTQDMFPAGVNNCVDFILSNGATWDFDNKLVNGTTNMRTAKIADGKELAASDNGYADATKYNVYVIPYNKALEPGETTLPGIVNVYLDKHVDIDTEGNWYKVEAGVATDLGWNTNNNGAPIIYVSAYGIQADGFEDVIDNGTVTKKAVEVAYEAYNGQWGDKGAEWADVTVAKPVSGATRPAGYAITETTGVTTVIEGVTVLDGSDDKTNLRALYKEGGITESMEVKDSVFDGTYAMNLTTTAVDKTLNFENTTFMGWVSYDGFESVTFTDCTFKINSEATYNYLRAYDATVFENCEFAGTTLDITGDGSITLKNCTYNGELIDSFDDLTLEDGVDTGKISITNA